MGAGKTTLGAELARRLARPFVDLDVEVERRVGPIPDYFARRGEAAFREVEAATLAEVDPAPAVIALGGGAATTAAVREWLRDAVTLLVEVDVEAGGGGARGAPPARAGAAAGGGGGAAGGGGGGPARAFPAAGGGGGGGGGGGAGPLAAPSRAGGAVLPAPLRRARAGLPRGRRRGGERR